MIYLFVIMLATGELDSKGWLNGKYSYAHGQFKTIAACEQARQNVIGEVTAKSPGLYRTLIAKCAAADDVLDFQIFTPESETPTMKPNA